MKGGIIQLRSKGIQDIFLTGKPVFNFIKQIYKQYEDFSIERTDLLATEIPLFGGLHTFDIRRSGDFLHKVYLCISLPKLIKTSGTYAAWTNSIGHAIIDTIDLEIGGIRVCREYGLFMEIWNEITTERNLRDTMLGKYNHIQLLKYNAVSDTEYLVPLQLWFCNNIGSSLPLLSLSEHSIKLIVKLKKFSECIVYDGASPPADTGISKMSLKCEYIFIDDYLKVKYTSTPQKFIINQIQMNEEGYLGSGCTARTRLTFNHPCSEIIFVLREIESEKNNDWFNFSVRDSTINSPILPILDSAKLEIDGNDFIEYTRSKELGLLNNARYHSVVTDKEIYVMSFCNEPEKWYPTGSLNMSAFTNTSLYLKARENINESRGYVFARNYNWITVVDGLMKLQYSI